MHRRILIPGLESNPGVPVHAIATTYLGTKFGRKRVEVNLSAPLPIDVATMHPNEVVEIMKNSFLDLGGMDYVDAFGRSDTPPPRTAQMPGSAVAFALGV
ncbi:MAG: hypothetical protein K0U30_08880 [Actinomycetia bacterium]|nr:hypothetical protein [Actinomycetes bacterium]